MSHSSLENALSHPAPWIVGVLNVTPDSFSESGALYNNISAALSHARQLLHEGAHIIEIGGEATGPRTSGIPSETELARIEEIVATLARECFVSVDTYHAATAERCLQLGARMINDISAFRADKNMATVARKHGAYVVLMHSKESGEHPQVSESEHSYADVIGDIVSILGEHARSTEESGIPRERIILDPGMGRYLSLNPEVSWELLRRFHELCECLKDYPVMVAVSRKGFLGGAVTERDPISQLTALHAVRAGATLIRTHNVKLCRQFLECSRKLGALSIRHRSPS